jgi:hypothetical protein
MLLSPGSKVAVVPAAIPDANYTGVCGQIAIIGQSSGSQQTFNLPVDMPTVDERLAPGFKADVTFDGGKLENVLLVPSTAIYHGKVWVIPADKFATTTPESDAQPQAVQIGATDGIQTQIKSGLKEGDIILTTAKHPGASGQ